MKYECTTVKQNRPPGTAITIVEKITDIVRRIASHYCTIKEENFLLTAYVKSADSNYTSPSHTHPTSSHCIRTSYHGMPKSRQRRDYLHQ
jgi:hypothetical protein